MPNRLPQTTAPLVAILAYDGLCTFEYGCAVEVFGLPRPEFGPAWYRSRIVAAEPGPLRGLGGLEIRADGGLELLDAAALIVIPGWRGPTAAAPPALLTALRQAHAGGARLAAICAGAFVLAQAGLLSGRRATTHWHHTAKLAAAFPDISVEPDVLYVDEGSLLTSAGSAAGLDLCLHLVRRDFGARIANTVARRLVVPAHRDGGQAQFIERPVPSRPGARLSALLQSIRKRIGEAWTLDRIASEAGMSLRGVHRHIRDATGMAPGEWLVNERIAQARELLEETQLSVEEVAAAVGFGAAATLRNHFRQSVGLSPARYRLRFDAMNHREPA